MKFAAFDDFNGSAKDVFDACGEGFACITTIDKNIDNVDQIAFVQSKTFQGSHPVRDVGRGNVNHMRQPICINAYMPFDARHQLAAIKAFLFRRIGILYALRVNDQKSCVDIPTKALSDLANHIFLMRPPAGCPRPCL